MKILVTGGAGYIGSHCCIELLKAGYELVVLDSLANSTIVSLERVAKIVDTALDIESFSGTRNEDCHIKTSVNDHRAASSDGKFVFIKGDIRNREILCKIFKKYTFEGVIHFAGLKAVGESVSSPLRYYDTNVLGSINLLQVMSEFNCRRLVFSSSATVYGEPDIVPVKEDSPLSTTNPYGSSKLMIENVLRDLYAANNAEGASVTWSIGILRYFNPVGAHESGLLGEDPTETPSNLMPFVAQVAAGLHEKLAVFGGDYATIDGTGVRDYIHVVDLAKGHVAALRSLTQSPGLITVNLGAGRGYSVLEMVKAFEKACGKAIPYEIVERRSGDIAECYADTSYALEKLGWVAEFGINRMCEDVWRWQTMNPSGYQP